MLKSVLKLSCAILLLFVFTNFVFAQQTEKTARNYYKLGLADLKKGRYDFAIEFFTIAIGVKPDFTEAYLARSTAKQYKRDFKGALADVQKIIKLDPTFGEAYFHSAQIRGYLIIEASSGAESVPAAELARKYGFMLEDYNSSVNAGYKTAEVYQERAEHQCELMKLCREAVGDFDLALAIKPGDPELQQKRSIAKYKSGDEERATADYLTIVNKVNLSPMPPGMQSVSARKGKNSLASQILVSVIQPVLREAEGLNNEGFSKEAIQIITSALASHPDNWLLYERRADYARASNNNDLVESDVLKLVKLKPFDFEIQKRAVLFLMQIERCRPALDIINASVIEDSQNSEAYLWRGNVKTCLGDFESALEDNDKAISLAPSNETYKANRANILNRQGKKEESLETYNDLINALESKLSIAADTDEKNRIKREITYAYIARSRFFAKQNEVAQAFADLDRAVQILPATHTYETRAKAYKWQKMYDRSIADFAEAIRLSPETSVFYYERGEVYFLMEKYDLALKDFQKAAEFKGEQFTELITRRIAETKAKLGQK